MLLGNSLYAPRAVLHLPRITFHKLSGRGPFELGRQGNFNDIPYFTWEAVGQLSSWGPQIPYHVLACDANSATKIALTASQLDLAPRRTLARPVLSEIC